MSGSPLSCPRLSRASKPGFETPVETAGASAAHSDLSPLLRGVDGRDKRGHDAQLRREPRKLRRRAANALLAAALLAAPVAARAVEPSEMLADPRLEGRARAITAELRCLVCQNQSIDDSDAPLAKDLRLIVREKLKEGATDAEVRAFVVARYGDFVLLRPPLKTETLVLWGAPLIALLGGGYAIYAAFRRSQRSAVSISSPLTDAERAQLQKLGATTPDREDEASA